MKRPKKMYRIAMTVPEENMQMIFDLLRGEATDFQMKEVAQSEFVNVSHVNGTQPTVSTGVAGGFAKKGGYITTPEQRLRWADRFWPDFKALMLQSPDQTINYNDTRLIKMMMDRGNNVSGISAIWSCFTQAGRVVRVGRGLYQLKEGQ